MINLIVGPMGSGKSAKLIAYYERMKKEHIESIDVYKPKIDTRNNNMIKSRNGKHISAHEVKSFKDILFNLKYCKHPVSAIIIDEIQFFNFDGFLDLYHYLMKHNMFCVLAGIDFTSEMKPFETVRKIMPYCHNISKLFGKCECGRPAHYSKCLVEKTEEILIGDDIYKPICYKCFQEEKTKC